MTQQWEGNFAIPSSFSRDSQSETNTHSNSVAATTPQFVITSTGKQLFKSTMADYLDHSPCLSFDIRRDRRLTFDSSGENSGDGRITIYNTIVLMRQGYWAPLIQECLDKGDYIESITIKRFANITGTPSNKGNVVIQESAFYSCVIKTYQQKEGMMIFSFGFKKHVDTCKSLCSEGTNKGVYSWAFDVETFSGKGEPA